MRRWGVIAVVLAPLVAGLVGAGDALARGPQNGRWVGTNAKGVSINFEVRRFRGRPVVVSPVITCPNEPSAYPGDRFSEHFDTGPDLDSPTDRELAGPIDDDGHVEFADDFASGRPPNFVYFTGRLHETRGTIIPHENTKLGLCFFRRMQVSRVTRTTYADGKWSGLGTFGTQIFLRVYAGGGVVDFRDAPETQWVGQPFDPEDPLGCAVSYGPTAAPVATGGTVEAGGLFANELEPGVLFVSGKFTSRGTMAGVYTGAFETAAGDTCSMNGGWGATLTGGFKGLRWPKGYRPPPRHPASCTLVDHVVQISVSATRYPAIIEHIHSAIRHGWPRVLVLNRPGAMQRRAKLLRRHRPRPGFDRDEYPPAILRGRGPGQRGTNPRGWDASVAYISPRQNRGAGTVQGIKLRRYCNGQRVELIGF